jgi:hypothetical protein
MEHKAPPSTPLEKHIAYFTNKNGYVNLHSICKCNRKLGFGWLYTTINAIGVTLMTCLKIGTFPSYKPAQALFKLKHLRDTGIWNADGTINETLWSKLVDHYSETHNGIQIITQSNLFQFLNNQWPPQQKPNIRMKAGMFLSNQEWTDFFDICTNHWKGDEKAVTITLLRAFYEDSLPIFQQVENGTLPTKKPI